MAATSSGLRSFVLVTVDVDRESVPGTRYVDTCANFTVGLA